MSADLEYDRTGVSDVMHHCASQVFESFIHAKSHRGFASKPDRAVQWWGSHVINIIGSFREVVLCSSSVFNRQETQSAVAARRGLQGSRIGLRFRPKPLIWSPEKYKSVCVL